MVSGIGGQSNWNNVNISAEGEQNIVAAPAAESPKTIPAASDTLEKESTAPVAPGAKEGSQLTLPTATGGQTITSVNTKEALDVTVIANPEEPAPLDTPEAIIAALSAETSGVSQAFKSLLASAGFKKASAATQLAILSQCKNYPNANSIKYLSRLGSASWFKKMDLADQQRAAKCIAYMAEVSIKKPGSEQNVLLNNTIERLFGSEIQLQFVPADGKQNYGYTKTESLPGMSGFAKTLICIKESFVPDGNDPFPVNKYESRHVVLATIAHEVNHHVNGDKNAATYAYFQAEYRAWYVGTIAETGEPPTRIQAYRHCNLLFVDYPNINKARTALNGHTDRIINFMQQFAPSSKRPTALEIMRLTVTDPNAPAPLPDADLMPNIYN